MNYWLRVRDKDFYNSKIVLIYMSLSGLEITFFTIKLPHISRFFNTVGTKIKNVLFCHMTHLETPLEIF